MLLGYPEILMLVLICQLLFISAFLFKKKGHKRISNNLLGLFFLFIGLAMADNFMIAEGIGYRHPGLVLWSSAFPLLYGPLLFLYTCTLLYKNYSFNTKMFWHFAPFTILFAGSLISYHVQSENIQFNMLHQINEHHIAPSIYLTAGCISVHFLIYAIFTLKIIKDYKKGALNNFSDVQQFNLKWLASKRSFSVVGVSSKRS